MRVCKIFRCKRTEKYMCCADCAATDCEERCKNTPEKCGVCAVEQKQSRPGRQKYDREKIVALYQSGLSKVEVAEEIGCAKSTVTAVLKEADVGKGENAK